MAERAQGRGVLSYLARAQRTVGEGLDAFARHAARAWQIPDAVRVERSGRTAVVRFPLDDGVPRHALEYLVARTALSLRRDGAPPREVGFRHAAGGPPQEYERVLRCPVRFGQTATQVVLAAEDLARPLRAANAEAARMLADALERAPLAAGAPGSAAARLATAVAGALARGARPDREALARSLGMSGKTLARRLAAERRTYRDVVDEVRRTLALRLLDGERAGEAPPALAEVAARAGFADLQALGKACRRWFGASPSALRARRRAG
jgi:AraC-like DNA-binding protein